MLPMKKRNKKTAAIRGCFFNRSKKIYFALKKDSTFLKFSLVVALNSSRPFL